MGEILGRAVSLEARGLRISDSWSPDLAGWGRPSPGAAGSVLRGPVCAGQDLHLEEALEAGTRLGPEAAQGLAGAQVHQAD